MSHNSSLHLHQLYFFHWQLTPKRYIITHLFIFAFTLVHEPIFSYNKIISLSLWRHFHLTLLINPTVILLGTNVLTQRTIIAWFSWGALCITYTRLRLPIVQSEKAFHTSTNNQPIVSLLTTITVDYLSSHITEQILGQSSSSEE